MRNDEWDGFEGKRISRWQAGVPASLGGSFLTRFHAEWNANDHESVGLARFAVIRGSFGFHPR